MIRRFPCPYLDAEVVLTEERERHIIARHPDLLPAHRQQIAETLAAPDHVRTSARFGSATLFARWYADLRQGKYVVVVVVSERAPQERHWIITAYLARKLAQGDIAWQRA
jgi:hypothetical protein